MRTSLKNQMLRSVLSELNHRIEPHLTDASALTALDMSKRLLALMLAEQDPQLGALRQSESGLPQATSKGPVIPWDEALANANAEACSLASMEKGEDLMVNLGNKVQSSPITPESLTPYVRKMLPQLAKAQVIEVVQCLGGFSKETYLVRMSGVAPNDERIVIRRDPDNGPVERLAAEEFPILQLTFKHGLPVPEPLWADKDAPFGRSVVVTRFTPGKSAFDLTGVALSRSAVDSLPIFARVLANLHNVPIDHEGAAAGLSQVTLESQVHKSLDDIEEQWRRRCLWTSPTIEAALRWLHENVPKRDIRPAIVHGDASLRNLLIHNGEPTALLDWELWHPGDPIEDLAYLRIELEELGVWSTFLAEYQAHGGQGYDEKVGGYYELWRALRNTILAGCAGHGFENAANPEVRLGYAGTFLYRRWLREVAAKLTVLSQQSTPELV